MAQIAHNYALLGANDAEIAAFLGVSLRDFKHWSRQHEELADALREGRSYADAQVAAALFKSAIGYTVREKKLVRGEVQEVETHVRPDVKAQLQWLERRRPDLWKPTTGPEDSGGQEQALPDMEVARRIAFLLAQAVEGEVIEQEENP